MLSQRLVSFIDILRPAFAKAEKAISGTQDSKEVIAACVTAGEESLRYRSADDLFGWLEHKAHKLAELIVKAEDGATNLDGKALNNLRQIRAFFIRFENVAKSEYSGISQFKAVEPELSKSLLEKFVPARNEGGVFAITRFILKDEAFHSKDDLGKIRHDLKVGKTIMAVVKAQKSLTAEKLKVVEVPELTREPQTEEPKPVAARALVEELNLSDPRREKPITPKRREPHKPKGEAEQQDLALR